VFKARHAQLKRVVALKVLMLHRVFASEGVRRFFIEMEVLGRLDHPNIIRATDAGETEGYLYLAMEYVAGTDLGRVLKRVGPLGVPDACALARQAAEALACLDRHGLTHRDVKPNNLLLGRDGILRALDMGLAQLRDAPPDERLTETGAVMGTPEYIAPEQARESRTVDIRADVYSLGCTLFALLTGAPPFPRGGSRFDLFRAHIETPPPALGAVRAGVPPELEQLVARMLEKDPARRPMPAEVAQALEPFCAGSDLVRLAEECGPAPEAPVVLPTVSASLAFDAAPTLTPPPTQSTTALLPPPGHTARRTKRWVFAAAALALVLGGVVWAAWPSRKGSTVQEPENGASAPPPPRVYTPGEWTELLDRPPEVREFPEAATGSHWRLEEKTEEQARKLYVHSTRWGILELEKMNGPFDFEVSYSQAPWVGGVGAFFGGRDEQISPDTLRWGRFIRLERFDGIPEKVKLQIGELRRSVPTNLSIPHFMEAVKVPRPLFDVHKLAFSVSAAGLSNVTWDEVPPVPGIPAGTAGPLTERAEGVGIVVQNCSVWFHSVRIRPHKPPGGQP
jgi:hypothetical protein